jgi:outer membrane lipoprotein-sorting protein
MLKRLTILALVLGCAPPAFAQTADEIVEKYLAAIGGRAALAKLTSRTVTGTITVSTPNGDVSGPIEVVTQAPNKSRTLVKLDLSSLGAGQVTIDQRFDGTTGYVIDTLQGNRDITGNQLENMRNGSFPTPLVGYKERGATVELAGKEKVGERDAYVLVFKPKTGPIGRQFIDADSYLPIRQVVKVDLPMVGEGEQTIEFSDFRDVDGIKVPFNLQATSAVQTTRIVVSTVEHNAKIDESLFSKPAPNK